MTARGSLTVLFDPPFWVGLCERSEQGRYEVCKVVFGAQPQEAEVYAFVLHCWDKLRFSPALPEEEREAKCASPKRVQRRSAPPAPAGDEHQGAAGPAATEGRGQERPAGESAAAAAGGAGAALCAAGGEEESKAPRAVETAPAERARQRREGRKHIRFRPSLCWGLARSKALQPPILSSTRLVSLEKL